MIEAYALGALDAQDRALLEAHLATGCAECAHALQEASWLVSQLAHLAPSVAPSEMLKQRLLQTVRAEAAATEGSASPQGLAPWWLWAGVAALLLFSAYSTWNATHLKAEIDEELIETYRSTVSLPFEAGKHKRAAVKIVDDRGIESLKIVEVK